MNWDDLRVVLAVHKSGSYSGASGRLRIDETTVARRLSRLQRDLGFPLFEAVDGVRKPTAQCLEILGHAERIARHVERISAVSTAADGLVGRYRIAATDSVAAEVLAPRAAAFLAEHQGLALHFLASTENVNFSRWEADIAIRLQKPEKGDFIISKLADVPFYLFEPADAGAKSERTIVCAYPEDLDSTPESQFMSAAGLQPRARCVSKNMLVMQSLIRTGSCAAVLPEFMCAAFRKDSRLKATRIEHRREVWLLMQDHLKHDPGARAVIDWIRSCFAGLGE